MLKVQGQILETGEESSAPGKTGTRGGERIITSGGSKRRGSFRKLKGGGGGGA